jgi:hypothetical protein
MIGLTVLSAVFFISMVETMKIIEIAVEEVPTVIDNTNDFPSTKEGTFVGIIDGNKNPSRYGEKIILFTSAKIPGLSLEYYPSKSKLVGGTPEMIAENIVIFDGQKHQIAYSFKRFSKQNLFFDGILVAESNFEIFPRHLTGLITGVEKVYVSELFEEYEMSEKTS